MNHLDFNTESKLGILGGTVLSAVVNIPGTELVNAIVLASIGAVSSYVATFVCKRVVDYLHKKYSAKK